MTRRTALLVTAALALTAPAGATAATPKVPKRPAAAKGIAKATITWHVRDSFVRYLAAGEGMSAIGGATLSAPVTTPETDAPLSYEVTMRRKAGGWRVASSGRARVLGTGGALFRFDAHGIRIRATNPEVELRGASSRVVFTVREGNAKGKRTVVMGLNPGGAKASEISPDGRTITYTEIPATVPKGTADSLFNGFYTPGEPFGWVTLSFTTAR